MKMNIEEKARAYDEAIKVAADIKAGTATYITDGTPVIDAIFPELKESEDERIRQFFIQEVTKTSDEIMSYRNMNKEDVLAWLEKQGEQKATIIIPKFRVGDEIKTSNEESLTITKIDEKGYWSEDLFICGFDDAAKWELVEQKPAWSEEDEELCQFLIRDLEMQDPLPTSIRSDSIKWLKFLKGRVQPQPKQEWNEGDKRIIDNLISQLGNLYARKLIKEETKDKYVNFLKSLKDRYTWKPSGFHLECISDAIAMYQERGINAIGLKEILEELKKLRGE